MKETKTIYFSHDTNASNDPKLIRIRMAFGWKGIAMYWAIIEALHKEKNGELPEDLVSSMILDFYSQEEQRQRNHVIDESDEYEEFLYTTALLIRCNGIVTSKRVKENLAEMNEKSEIARQKANKRWGNISEDNATAMQQQYKGNAIKGKEIKENNIIIAGKPANDKIPLEGSLQDLYKNFGLPNKVRSVNIWQDDAANAVKFFHDGAGHTGSIFKCFKDNQQKARIALSDCKELGKNSTLYFFKVYNELTKK